MTSPTRASYSQLYTEEQLTRLEREGAVINDAFIRYRTANKLYDNQRIAAQEIADAFKDPQVLNVMAVAPTQSGKTGIMFACIEELYKSGNVFEDYHIYVITGLSSTAWLEQTSRDIPAFIHCNVYHLPYLTTAFVEDIKDKSNVLILIDEVQVAAKDYQTLLKAFRLAGLMNKANMYSRHVKVVNITATPDGLIYSHKAWSAAAKRVFIEPGAGYTSCFDLLNEGRVFQAQSNLSGWCYKTKQYACIDEALNSIREIKPLIDPSSPRYHIIRTQRGVYQDATIDNFRQVFMAENNEFSCQFIRFDGKVLKACKTITDINDILMVEPRVHTFIFIKDMLRCAKRIVKTHLGVLYERLPQDAESIDDGCMIQGLLGRSTGYDDSGKHYCFTNIDTITRYGQLISTQFEAQVGWNSKTSRFTNGQLIVKESFGDGGFFDGTKKLAKVDTEDNE